MSQSDYNRTINIYMKNSAIIALDKASGDRGRGAFIEELLEFYKKHRSEVSDERESCRSRKTPRSGTLGEACQNNAVPVEREADSRGKERAEIPAEAVALRGRQ